MKNKEQFEKTVKALTNAFINGTLAKYNCYACAVGNIIAYNREAKYDKNYEGLLYTVNDDIVNAWGSVFSTDLYGTSRFCSVIYKHDKEARESIKSSGYEIRDLRRIENAFERATFILEGNYRRYPNRVVMEDQYNGLMACIDVLMKIHECNDMSIKESFDITLKNHLETVT